MVAGEAPGALRGRGDRLDRCLGHDKTPIVARARRATSRRCCSACSCMATPAECLPAATSSAPHATRWHFVSLRPTDTPATTPLSPSGGASWTHADISFEIAHDQTSPVKPGSVRSDSTNACFASVPERLLRERVRYVRLAENRLQYVVHRSGIVVEATVRSARGARA